MLRKPAGGALKADQLQTYQEDGHLDKLLHYYSSRKNEGFLLPQQQLSQWEPITTRPMRNHYTFNTQFTPMDFLFTSALPSPPFLYERAGSACCSGSPVLDCNSLLLPTQPSSAGKPAGSFIFKVNATHHACALALASPWDSGRMEEGHCSHPDEGSSK